MYPDLESAAADATRGLCAVHASAAPAPGSQEQGLCPEGRAAPEDGAPRRRGAGSSGQRARRAPSLQHLADQGARSAGERRPAAPRALLRIRTTCNAPHACAGTDLSLTCYAANPPSCLPAGGCVAAAGGRSAPSGRHTPRPSPHRRRHPGAALVSRLAAGSPRTSRAPKPAPARAGRPTGRGAGR